MKQLLTQAIAAGASDLHLTAGAPPLLRVHGGIELMDADALQSEDIKALVYPLLNDAQIESLEDKLELCFSLSVLEQGYFRVNLYYHRGAVEAAIRIGLIEPKSADELGLPAALMEMTRRPNGLILIAGATGQGKTTTFNTMIDFVNRERRCKINTVEDPVEYQHKNLRSIVVQQELFTDTWAFDSALRHILRQDPDIIGVGEMRDLETIRAAVTAAETGHLVIATLHTSDAAQTVHRIVDVFPPDQQAQIRIQLADSLVGIINQNLLPRADIPGRVLAYELLIANEAVRNLIRENKLNQLVNVITTGRRDGMVVVDDMIRDYYEQGVITYDTALTAVQNPKAFQKK